MNSRPLDYPFLFDGKYGFILHPVMRRLFNQINIPGLYKESIGGLAQKGHIVFVHNTTSAIDSMLLNYRFAQEGLPVPRLIFGMRLSLFQPAGRLFSLLKALVTGASSPFEDGAYRTYMTMDGHASMMSLGMATKYLGYDPVLELLKIQRETDSPIYLIPQRIVYNRVPLKLKDATKEEQISIKGMQKVMTLLRAEEHGFVEHGEPVNLGEVIRHSAGTSRFFEEIAVDVRNELQQRLSVLGRNISGAPSGTGASSCRRPSGTRCCSPSSAPWPRRPVKASRGSRQRP
jgi:glycerol-3-phosphate O-acyltransferase